MTMKSLSLLYFGAALLFSLPVAAQAAPAPNNAPDLAVSLAAARPLAGGMAIAVAADRIPLPEDAEPPPTGATLGTVADSYGRLLRPFGTVTAVAPRTMVILNTHPTGTDLLADLKPSEALLLLGASLSDAQWQAFTSAGGLGLADLQSDWQRALFATLFHGQAAAVYPLRAGDVTQNPPHDFAVSTADLLQSRIRLTGKISLWLQHGINFYIQPGNVPITGGQPQARVDAPLQLGQNESPATPGSTTMRFRPGWQPPAPQEDLYGQPARKTVTNTPKPGDLNIKDPRFDTPIPVMGLKTVGDLIVRIGLTTRTELYVDRRSESKTLTLIGPAKTAPARDLLEALAFDLTGTYRNVGPAFVLTDDRMGVGTRREILEEYQQSLAIKRQQNFDDAMAKLAGRPPINDLPLSSDSLPLSPEQISEWQRVHPDDGPVRRILDLPFSQLTPAQQAIARRVRPPNSTAAGSEWSGLGNQAAQEFARRAVPPDSTGDDDDQISLESRAAFEVIAPGLPGPIDLSQEFNTDRLFPPSDAADKLGATQKLQSQPVILNTPSIADLIRPYAHRAAIVAPRSPAELDALIAPMEKLGLNEMWIVISAPDFPEAATSSSALPTNGSAAPPDRLDLLTEAVKVTRGTGIVVLPVMDLTRWGPDTPVTARDLNILGQDSTKFDERMREQIESETGRPQPPWPAVYSVSPFVQSVQDRLVDLVRSSAASPGIAGLVWRSLDPFGYQGSGFLGGPYMAANLGFTLPARLAFLRKEHADPVDIDLEGAMNHLNDSLPEFDNTGQNQALLSDWGQFLASQDQNLLRRLFGVARESARFPIPILLEGVTRYFSWNYPAEPVLTESYMDRAYSSSQGPAATKPGADIEKVAVYPQNTIQGTTRQLLTKAKQQPWNGVALNLEDDRSPRTPPDQLLARLLPPSQAETPAPPSQAATPAPPKS